MNNRSLEDTIRAVRKKYQNRPSPLAGLNSGMQQIPNMTPQQTTPTNPRDMLTRGFVPPRDTFR